jgi:hypothetical protein
MGMVDPEDLLKVSSSKARGTAGGNGNGSSNGTSSTPSRQDGSSAPTSRSSGSDGLSAGQQTPPSGSDTDDTQAAAASSALQTVASQESDWGLLQLDLSFAWELEDKTLADVDAILADAALTASK